MKIREEMINLIREGKSINQIRRITGFAKSTIYHHYKKIKGKKYKDIYLNFKNSDEIGEFLGIFAGDGGYYVDKNYHHRITIHTGYYEKKYRKYLKKKLFIWFNKKPFIYYRSYKGHLSSSVFQYNSKKLYNLIKQYLKWNGIKTYTVKLNNLDFKNKQFNLGFLRGLIDTDGNYYAPKRRLSFSSVSKELANQFYQIVKYNLNIEPKFMITYKINRAPLYTIYLHGANAKVVIEAIKPNNPNKDAVVV